jgi:hypothetical protein
MSKTKKSVEESSDDQSGYWRCHHSDPRGCKNYFDPDGICKKCVWKRHESDDFKDLAYYSDVGSQKLGSIADKSKPEADKQYFPRVRKDGTVFESHQKVLFVPSNFKGDITKWMQSVGVFEPDKLTYHWSDDQKQIHIGSSENCTLCEKKGKDLSDNDQVKAKADGPLEDFLAKNGVGQS